MTGRVDGKVAIVTGAAHGLGRAIALRLAAEGAAVVGIDVDAVPLEATVGEIGKAGGRAVAMTGDVTEPAPVERMVAAAIAAFGRIDILVNNVGGGGIGRLWEAEVEDWDRVLRLNLRSTFLCTKAVLQDMMPRRAGRIVCLSSGAREGTPWTAYYTGNTAYAAAKAGVHGFIRNAALELAQYNIAINAVAPGPINTERTAPAFERMANEPFGPIPMTPLHRIGEPMDVAHAVLFLASDEAGYITGTTLAVAGGR
jgi:NAD(P)-dependent dehydrogenase (short-subunit alcohol dehydrogenase family)